MTHTFRGVPAPDWLASLTGAVELNPIGNLFDKVKYVPGPGKADEYQRLSLTMRGVLPRSKDDNEGLQPGSFDDYQLLRPNQLVFKLIDLDNVSTSRVGLSDAEGLVSPAYIVVEATDSVMPKYAYWYFTDLYNRQIFNRLGEDGVRSSLSWGGLKKLPFPSRRLKEQERIARFLDEETAKIDNLIKKYERLLELSAAQAETRWHQLFAGLLMHPERPLKRVLQKVTRPAFAGEGVITAFRDGQVTLRANRREEGFTFSDTEDGYQGIKPGDLVYHGLDGFAGAVGVSDSHGNGSPVYHVCRPLDEQDSVHFMAAYLRFLGLSGFLATQAPNVRQRSVDFRNWETFSRIPMRVPSRREQDEIVTRLEEFKTSRETTEELTQRAIALLRERRSALITAAVTGQIEV